MCCEWYAASLALPVNDFPVLVTYKKTWHAGKRHQPRRPKQVTVAVYGDDMAWHFVRKQDQSNRPERITHWMPLPEPAVEGERGSDTRAITPDCATPNPTA